MVKTWFSKLTQAEIEAFIIDHWKQRALENGCDIGNVDASMDLMQTSGNTDSLELAVLVSELEQHTGKDPFASSIPEFRTISDLARLYVD